MIDKYKNCRFEVVEYIARWLPSDHDTEFKDFIEIANTTQVIESIVIYKNGIEICIKANELLEGVPNEMVVKLGYVYNELGEMRMAIKMMIDWSYELVEWLWNEDGRPREFIEKFVGTQGKDRVIAKWMATKLTK